MTALPARRSFSAPEVVQTSVMDCGPAALASLLGGYGIRSDYERLREVCQTDVDGTSIDALETVANELGLAAEQVLVPADTLFLDGLPDRPALAVVRQPDGAAHFVVVWRRVGPWLQVMDPAKGRRWIRRDGLRADLWHHELSVPAADWRDHAGSDAFIRPLRLRLAGLGLGRRAVERLIRAAAAEAGWFPLATLDAATRLCARLAAAGGIAAGREAERLTIALVQATLASPDDIHRLIPAEHWSVRPDPDGRRNGERHLLINGAVLVQIEGLHHEAGAADAPGATLAHRLAKRQAGALPRLLRLLAAEGPTAMALLVAGSVVAAVGTLVEALVLRALLDVGTELSGGMQQAVAVLAAALLLVAVAALSVPLSSEAQRLGRRIEARLRLALHAKLPRLPDRFFSSRPITDLAERAHALGELRSLPATVTGFVRGTAEMTVTVLAIGWIAPASLLPAVALAIGAASVPLLFGRLTAEADLRVRSHGAALMGCLLDTLLAVVPIRVHGAERAMRRRHDELAAAWAGAIRSLVSITILSDALQQLVCLAGIALVLGLHTAGLTAVGGTDLLLVWWVMKLPGIGLQIASALRRLPSFGNVARRLAEPLEAAEAGVAPATSSAAGGAVSIRIESGAARAAGHTILHDIDLAVTAGEHVAVVGASGAGKSTLLGLLLGWHALSEGRLLLDGAATGETGIADLRRRTAWIDPGVRIWNRSLIDNVVAASALRDPAKAVAAIEAADLDEVVARLPQGLRSPLGDGGGLVSGGEGQRIRLARALAQEDVRLVLMDEPFRGLDRARRRDLMAAVRARFKDATLLCVTHDIADTLTFERVLVVDDGTIAEDGAPRTLAASDSRFAGLLAAERSLETKTRFDNRWRRLRVSDGRVEERP